VFSGEGRESGRLLKIVPPLRPYALEGLWSTVLAD
jgi:hypothetical protein